MMGLAGYGLMGGVGMAFGLLFWVGLLALVVRGVGATNGARTGGDREEFERARETLA